MHGMYLVFFFVKNPFNASVNQHFQTMNAGGVGNIDVRVTDADAVLSRLGNGVDFRVDRAVTVLFRLAARRLRLVN